MFKSMLRCFGRNLSESEAAGRRPFQASGACGNDAMIAAHPCGFDVIDVSLSHVEAHYHSDCVIVISDTPGGQCSSSAFQFLVPPPTTSARPRCSFGQRQSQEPTRSQLVQDTEQSMAQPSEPSFTTDADQQDDLDWTKWQEEAQDWEADQWETSSKFSCVSGFAPNRLMINAMVKELKTRTSYPGV